jgi:hypothetical protein
MAVHNSFMLIALESCSDCYTIRLTGHSLTCTMQGLLLLLGPTLDRSLHGTNNDILWVLLLKFSNTKTDPSSIQVFGNYLHKYFCVWPLRQYINGGVCKLSHTLKQAAACSDTQWGIHHSAPRARAAQSSSAATGTKHFGAFTTQLVVSYLTMLYRL